jgi:hypothetical protein
MKPEPLSWDVDVDCSVVDEDVLAAVLDISPVIADVAAVADADALVPLVLSGKPPANAFGAPIAATPTTSDFNRWRIYCAPQTLKTYTAQRR